MKPKNKEEQLRIELFHFKKEIQTTQNKHFNAIADGNNLEAAALQAEIAEYQQTVTRIIRDLNQIYSYAA